MKDKHHRSDNSDDFEFAQEAFGDVEVDYGTEKRPRRERPGLSSSDEADKTHYGDESKYDTKILSYEDASGNPRKDLRSQSPKNVDPEIETYVREHRDRGYRTVPIAKKVKVPVRGAKWRTKDSSTGDYPSFSDLDDPANSKLWSRAGAVAVVTGEPVGNSGLTLVGLDIDVDHPETVNAIIKWVEDNHSDIGSKFLVRRGGGGIKVLIPVAIKGNVKKSSSVAFTMSSPTRDNSHSAMIEVLGSGQYFVSDGAHSSGSPYTWLDDRSLKDCGIQNLPLVTATWLNEYFMPACLRIIRNAGFTKKPFVDNKAVHKFWEDADESALDWERFHDIFPTWSDDCRCLSVKCKDRISRAICRVISAPEGMRNDNLNASAYLCGRAIRLESPSEDQVENVEAFEAKLSGMLYDAAVLGCDMDSSESVATINSGLERGFEIGESDAADRDASVSERALTKANISGSIFSPPNVVIVKNKPPKILNTAPNLQAVCDHLDLNLSWDVLLKREHFSGRMVDGYDVKTRRMGLVDVVCSDLVGACSQLGVPATAVGNHYSSLFARNPINRVLDWLQFLPEYSPDVHGDPLTDLTKFIPTTANPEWTHLALKRWLVQCVAAADCAFSTPIEYALPKYENVLVLMGDQGIKKTEFISRLIPKDLRVYYKIGQHLQLGNKDSELACVAGWIVELGELDSTFKKSETTGMKAHLSKSDDEIRLPYARGVSRFPRQTSYIGTVNEEQFLRDLTGNRRYWPLKLTGRIVIPEDFDVTALWSQIWTMYLNGERWWMEDAIESAAQADAVTIPETALQKEATAKHEETDSMREALLDLFDFDSEKRELKMTGTEVAAEISIGAGGSRLSKGDSTRLGMLLKKLGIKNASRKYRMPPRMTDMTYEDDSDFDGVES